MYYSLLSYKIKITIETIDEQGTPSTKEYTANKNSIYQLEDIKK